MANATVAEWYRTRGRHAVHAKGKDLELPEFANPLTSQVPDVPDYVKSLNEKGRVKLRVLA